MDSSPDFTTATVTTLVLSTIGIGLSHLLTRSRADSEYRLQKLSELYVALDQHEKYLFTNYGNFTLFARGSIDIKGLTEKLAEPIKVTSLDDSAIEAAINILFPELKARFKEWQKAKTNAGEVQTKMLLTKDVPSRTNLMPDLSKCVKIRTEMAHGFREEISILASKIRSGWAFSWLMAFFRKIP